MGLKGTRRRLKNFDSSATAFTKDFRKGNGYSQEKRHYTTIFVGRGNNRRRIIKPTLAGRTEMELAKQAETILIECAKKSSADSFVFVPVKSNPKLGVQQYFNKPSLRSLWQYFWAKKRNRKSWFGSREEYLVIKGFVKSNPKINYEALLEAESELMDVLWDSGVTKFLSRNTYNFSSKNIIVLGQNKDGKLRLAFIDV